MHSLKIITSISIAFFVILSTANAETPKKIVESRGGGKVKAVEYGDGTWQLLVDGKPYFIKGVMYAPVKIGESPDEATMRDWMYYDEAQDGRNDVAYKTWLDKNKNNKRDPDEEIEGDFSLLKKMGCNTIRLYHVASDNPILGDIYKTNKSTALQYDHPVNKKLLRQLYKDYGIRVIMGNYVGAWTIGSDAPWEEGTDYSNPKHCENIKKSVKAMVLDNKDEPYVLMWLLGNENNLGDWLHCNASRDPQSYAKLIGELAEMIHQLDPDHPVAVCDGDKFNTLPEYAKYAQALDIIAFNCYRGKYGFGPLWKQIKRTLDRPVFISEYGMFAYNKNVGEDEDMQLDYIKGCWHDIVMNKAENYDPMKKLSGNSIGGVVFDWLDRWYMDGSPGEHNPGERWGDSPDNLRHEEWFGIMSMGNGSDSLMRQPRKAYYYLKDTWKSE